MSSLSPVEATRLAHREAAQADGAAKYIAALAQFEAARAEHKQLLDAGIGALSMLAEARVKLERAKAASAVARAYVINAAWQEKLSKAENLGRAVEVLLAGIVADARRQGMSVGRT